MYLWLRAHEESLILTLIPTLILTQIFHTGILGQRSTSSWRHGTICSFIVASQARLFFLSSLLSRIGQRTSSIHLHFSIYLSFLCPKKSRCYCIFYCVTFRHVELLTECFLSKHVSLSCNSMFIVRFRQLSCFIKEVEHTTWCTTFRHQAA